VTGFAGLLFAVAAGSLRSGVGGRALLRRAAASSIGSAISSCERIGGLALAPMEGDLGEPDGSADAVARDGVAGDELVARRGGRAELLGGLGAGQQAGWGSGGRWRHRGLLVGGFGGPGRCSALGRCAHLSTRRSRLAHGPTQSWLSMPPAALTRARARLRGRSPRAAREWHVRRPRRVLGRGSKSANSSAIVSQVSQVDSRAGGLGRTPTDLDGRSRVPQDRCARPL
jgi:hypothetical protein